MVVCFYAHQRSREERVCGGERRPNENRVGTDFDRENMGEDGDWKNEVLRCMQELVSWRNQRRARDARVALEEALAAEERLEIVLDAVRPVNLGEFKGCLGIVGERKRGISCVGLCTGGRTLCVY